MLFRPIEAEFINLKGIAFICYFFISQAFGDVVRYTLSKRKTFRCFEREVLSNIYMMSHIGCGLSGWRHVCMVVRLTVWSKIFAFDIWFTSAVRSMVYEIVFAKKTTCPRQKIAAKLTSYDKSHFSRLVFEKSAPALRDVYQLSLRGFPAHSRQLQGDCKDEIHTYLATSVHKRQKKILLMLQQNVPSRKHALFNSRRQALLQHTSYPAAWQMTIWTADNHLGWTNAVRRP